MRFAFERYTPFGSRRLRTNPLVDWVARGETREVSLFLGYGFACVLWGLFFLDKTPIRTAFYLAVLVPALRYLRRGTMRALARLDYWWMVMALAALSLISIAWSADATLESAYDAARLTLIVALFFTAAARVAQRGHLPEVFLFRGLVATAVVVALATISYRYATGELLQSGYRLRGFGFSFNPVLGASLQGFAATAALLLAASTQDLRTRLAYGAALCVCLLFVVLTGSRGPTLAFLLAAGVLSVLHGKRGTIAVFAAAGIGVGVLAGALGLVDFGEWIERGSNSRFLIWEQVTRHALEAPLLGLGAATPIDVTTDHINSAHNVFLGLFFHLGILGPVLFLGVSLLACLHAVKSALARDFWPLTLFAYGYTILLTDSQNVLINLSREWLIFWLPLLMVIARHRPDTSVRRAAQTKAG